MNRKFWGMTALNLILAALLVASVLYAYVWQQLIYKRLPLSASSVTFVINPGTSLKQFAHQLAAEKIIMHPTLFSWLAISKGYANTIKAGEYQVTSDMSALDLLNIVVAGKEVQYAFTIIEGWRSKDVIKALQQHPKIKHDLVGLSAAEVINKLNIPVNNLEGMFWPDTYYFTAGTSDVQFLRRAYNIMQKNLQAAWESRDPKVLLSDPYETLILASIIEKESGLYDEYADISSVLQLRLAKKMRLQADPTVIYALGDAYPGKLSKQHLLVFSPYNTYINFGLPPTPIAIPSKKAIYAALHPNPGDNLYFVASGDGRHVFSKNLVSHNKAVQKLREL